MSSLNCTLSRECLVPLEQGKTMKFSQINSADQLFSFLENQRHKFYHHFTTVSALNAILTQKKWLLSPAQRMNDLHECNEKGRSQRWKRLVSTCFSFGDEDNMAMWAIYGLPWEQGVRITIPGTALRQWIAALQDSKWQHEHQVECVSLHDMVYYDGYVDRGNADLRWARGKCKTMKDGAVDIALSERFTGYVKNSAWKQESEARLMVVLKNDSVENFHIPIPESVLTSFKICLGPMVAEAAEQVLPKILKGVRSKKLRSSVSENFRSCFFQNRVHLKHICDYCAHTYKSKDDHA